MDWLTATKSFCLLVHKGSFTQAANLAEISPSAMSKRIDWLEKQLGLSLFVRTTRQVNLTEAGSDFLPRAQSLLKQFDAMLCDTQQSASNPSGMLNIAATLPVGSSILMPHIEAFLALYPLVKIQLDVLPFGEAPDLDHDLVICKKQDDFNSAAHKGTMLITHQMGLYAAPQYLTQHKKISCLADVSEHKIIMTSSYRKMGRIEMENGEVCLLNNFNFVSDHRDPLLYAAVNAMGLIFVSPIYIKNELEQGLLVRLLPAIKTAKTQLWAFYPNTEFMPVKSRLFLDFLKQRL